MRAPTLLLVALTALAGGCSQNRPPDQSAAADFRTHCMSCHGLEGGGVQGLGPLGLPLADKGEHWDEDGLVRYLTDPQAFSKSDPRLEGRMPQPPAEIEGERRVALARHVLWLMSRAPR